MLLQFMLLVVAVIYSLLMDTWGCTLPRKGNLCPKDVTF